MERICTGIDIVYPAVLGHKFSDVIKLFGAAVDVRLSCIFTASAVFCRGTVILDRRQVVLSGTSISALHFSGSGATVHNVLEKHGSRNGTYSSRYGGNGFRDL